MADCEWSCTHEISYWLIVWPYSAWMGGWVSLIQKCEDHFGEHHW